MSKPRNRPLVDEKSFALAEHFLQDHIHTKDDTWNLAGEIQRSVEDWFEYQEIVAERRKREAEIRARLCQEADETDFAIMRWGQRNPRACASNAPTGEPIHYGGRRQP